MIQNVTNAFIKVEHEGKTFLADLWVSDGIFDGGWSPYPPIRQPDAVLRQADYLYLSHIHEDHYDLKAIGRLPKSCHVLIPNIFPNHLMRDRVAALGFERITMLNPLTPTELAPGMSAEVIPPMNEFGQEEAYYEHELEAVAIDTGIVLNWDGCRMMWLNDNTPYDAAPIRAGLDRFAGCDLLAVNYNGGADDYPICYRGLSDAEKRAICDQRDAKKLEANNRLIELLRPKAIMAYSSDFSVRGRWAKAYAEIRAGMFNDKRLMAAHFEEAHRIPAFAMFEEDRLELNGKEARKHAGVAIYPAYPERAAELYDEAPNYSGLFPQVDDLVALRQDAERAAEHMFRYVEKYRWLCDWVLEIWLSERCFFAVDFNERRILDRAPDGRKVLRCFTDAQYFGALIRRAAHWNNAMISYNLEWERLPNEYHPFLYKALCFFHV